jgi:hypothetical protein
MPCLVVRRKGLVDAISGTRYNCDTQENIAASSNQYFSVGAYLCREFGGDCRYVAWSRGGVHRNQDNTAYPSTIAGRWHSTLGTNNSTMTYTQEFPLFVPRVVVIHLGVSDLEAGVAATRVRDALVQFTTGIRGYYSKSSTFFFLTCTTSSAHCGAVKEVCPAQRAASVGSGDVTVSLLARRRRPWQSSTRTPRWCPSSTCVRW